MSCKIFCFAIVLLTIVMMAKKVQGAPQSNFGDSFNKDCSRDRQMRGEAIWSNRVIKAGNDKSYNSQLTDEEVTTITDTTYAFLDTYYGEGGPCVQEYHVCVIAAKYEDSCLPLGYIVDILTDTEAGSDLFRKFRDYFYANYDSTTCTMRYITGDFDSCSLFK